MSNYCFKYWPPTGFIYEATYFTYERLVGWLWTKHQILLGPRCYLTSDLPLVELSPCSKGGQGEGETAVIAHQSSLTKSSTHLFNSPVGVLNRSLCIWLGNQGRKNVRDDISKIIYQMVEGISGFGITAFGQGNIIPTSHLDLKVLQH